MASIKLEDVVVEIPIYNASSRSLKNSIVSSATGGEIFPRGSAKSVIIRALDGVDLEVEHKARIGLLGHNGSGKSTILRVMAGIYEPTAGLVCLNGDAACMFDIGFGMDPEASGWENIVIRGMYLGYTRREIEARTEDIGTLTGLGEFLNMPLRTYSSGMSTRLAFAVSTSIKPDILLIDEGIGAGDASFVAQASERIQSLIDRAGILVMASHSDDLLRSWCTEGVWMEHGRIRMRGNIEAVLKAYASSV